ncbi:hypothetical protein ACTXT7_000994 [Hymenolepis weldensis]
MPDLDITTAKAFFENPQVKRIIILNRGFFEDVAKSIQLHDYKQNSILTASASMLACHLVLFPPQKEIQTEISKFHNPLPFPQ